MKISVSVTDGPRGETFSLAWGSGKRLCFAEGLVGLTSHSRGEWHPRQRRESKQKDKMRVSMARCVTEDSRARLEWWMMNLESKVCASGGSITSNCYFLNCFMCEFFLEIVSFIW